MTQCNDRLVGHKSHVAKLYAGKSRLVAASWLSAVSIIALAATGTMISLPAMAASGGVGFNSKVITGGAGGADGTSDTAIGQDGPETLIQSGGGGGAVDLTTGQGAQGGNTWRSDLPNKGVKGANGATGQTNIGSVDSVISGGKGADGAANNTTTKTTGSGGGGGGVGVSTSQDIIVGSSGVVTGGAGGTGGTLSGGGGGGSGIFTSANVVVNAGGKVTGGAGASGSNHGGGGGGAAAIIMTGGGVLTNTGTITGGNGGGAKDLFPTTGNGGNGGEGVLLTNGGKVVNNSGAVITGGKYGNYGTNLAGLGVAGATGGNGISGANVSVVNAGTISGVTNKDASFVEAIKFTGGVNSLEIWSTSVINGNVQAFSSADKFILGGANNSSFDVSTIGKTAKYRDFGSFEKTGTSTWTLTGANTGVTPWTLSDGTLSISQDESLGDEAGALTFNGGTLQTTASFDINRAITLTAAGGTLDTATDTILTVTSAIDGAGALTKIGAGTLVLTGNNSYSGGTAINAGILQLGDGGTTGSIIGNIVNNGTLAVNRSDTLTLAGAISGTGSLNQAGAGITILTGNNSYSGGTTISTGTLQLGDGSTSGGITGTVLNNGALVFKRSDLVAFDGVISGTGTFKQSGTGTLVLTGNNSYSGETTVEAGTLVAGADNVLSASSAHSVLDGAKLDLDGHNQTVASLNNAGTVYLNRKGNTVATTLTITGDYVGNNGTIVFNTALAGDSSKTDRLVVNGGTSGSTNVQVRNLNGTGAQTVDGIKLIEVVGTSDGAFSLQGDYKVEGEQAVIGGAYAYRLYQNGVNTPTDGDWYLRSELKDKTPLYQAGVSVYEAYAGALLNLNSVSTLQQRVGTRYTNDGGAEQNTTSETTTPAVWGRVEAAHSKFAPKTSTSSTDYDLDTLKMQAGLDGQLYESANGKLIGGLTVHYSKASADANSFIGTGKIDIDGYGFGGTLTWYGQNGLYVDGQAQATLYKSDLYSHTMDQGLANGNDAFGYVLSVETGQRFDINQNWSLTPQAQLGYSSVDFDSFDSVFKSGSAHVSLGKADSLKTRLGVSADYQNSWAGSDGKAVRSNVYGIANLYHEFLDGTDVNVSGVNFASENDRTWGGIGAGGTYNWANNKYSLYGEVSLNTSLSNFADSYSVGGTAGFKIAF